MAETLYRKYRPQTFGDVREQRHVVQTLMQQLRSGRVAHAYLFSGPRGVGKTTLARLLAKAVNCEKRGSEAEPCNACAACTDFAAGRYLDTVEIDAASHTGVDNVRENVIEQSRFVPQRGTYKVFIIDEVHMLSTSAFNALLKTLEEPPAHVLFIFATTELHKIPATIVSRCQRFDFHRIGADEMVKRLGELAKKEGVTVDDAVLKRIARLSEGALRDAESLLGQVLSLGKEKITAEDTVAVLPATHEAFIGELLSLLAAHDAPAMLAKLSTFVEQGGNVKEMTDEMIAVVRDRLFANFDPRDRELLDRLLAARFRPTLALFPQLPLEIALIEFLAGEARGERREASPVAPLTPKVAPPKPPSPSSPPDSRLAPPSAPTGSVSFSLDNLVGKWERCCAYVADRNVALPLILRNAKPHALQGSTLTVAFEYAFHADTFQELKNLRLLEEAIAAVMMEPVMVKTVVIAPEEHDGLGALAQAFGGSVVG